MTLLISEVGDLVCVVQLARAEQSKQSMETLLDRIQHIERHLGEIRESYRFNDLIGLSAIHAALYPAIHDIGKWSSEGVYQFKPTSPETLKLIELRASQANQQATQLLSESAGEALEILSRQAWRMSGFRQVIIIMLGIMAVMSLALGFFVLRQQRTLVALKESEEQIRYRANFDLVTGLPNRPNFIEHLSAAVARSRRTRGLIALLFIDLDRFKTINDTLGHDIGDQLIKEAGSRIVANVRSTDMVARLGGDEFTVLLQDMSDAMHAPLIAESINEQLTMPFRLDGHEVYSSASIGITICPIDSEDASTLLKNADMAMYQAKDMGRNTFRFFTKAMTNRARQFLELDKDLRRAIERDEMFIQFQPIYDLRRRMVAGVEALMRWKHPEKGIIMPEVFIPVAEETGLIVEMGYWVLDRASREAMRWQQLGSAMPYLAVNVSTRQIKGGFCGEKVSLILEQTGFPPEKLVLELTESLLMEEDKRVHATLDGFRSLGIEFAVDDFGTGYSALNYLRSFPVSTLKIDRSFINDMVDNQGDAQLVDSIVAMAGGLNVGVVAEGVETLEQASILRKFGCTLFQGFLYGKPVDADTLFRILIEDTIPDVISEDGRSAQVS